MKKEFLVLAYSKHSNWYYGKEISSDEMSVLEMFLAEDYGLYKYSRLIKWAEDPSFHYRHANITFLRKELGNMIIGDLYDKESSIRKFSLPIKKFIKLLNDWEDVGIKYPKEIVITKKGDNIIVEGKN